MKRIHLRPFRWPVADQETAKLSASIKLQPIFSIQALSWIHVRCYLFTWKSLGDTMAMQKEAGRIW